MNASVGLIPDVGYGEDQSLGLQLPKLQVTNHILCNPVTQHFGDWSHDGDDDDDGDDDHAAGDGAPGLSNPRPKLRKPLSESQHGFKCYIATE